MENENSGDTILEGYDDIDFTDIGEFKGPRDVLILVSRQDGLGSPRKQGQFFLEDVTKLRSEKIPEEHWNDEAKILEDRLKREKEMFKRKRKIDVVVQVESKPNTTVGHAIDCITNLMEARNYEDRMKEILICYFGNGRESDGAWCFKHGYITFDFILQLYKEFKRGRIVTVLSDCPGSHRWIQQYHVYLDSHRMKPCGHYGKRSQNFLQLIATSSESDHESCGSANVMAVRGFGMDAYGRVQIKPNQFEVAVDQHLSYCNPGILTCASRKLTYTCTDCTCSLQEDSRWCKSEKGQHVVLLTNSARTRWAYVCLNDDQDVHDVCNGNLDAIQDYKEIIIEGEGAAPPVSVRKKVLEEYPLMCMTSSWSSQCDH